MPFIGNQPALSYTSFAKQDFTTSATTSYTLDHPVTNENEIALFINFVRQEPTTAYTASGTSLTLTSATSSSDDMYCVYLGKAVQTVNPPNNSVGTAQLADDAVTKAKTSALMYPAFEAYLSSNQAVSDGSTTKVQIDTEIFDTDSCYDNSTNYRFTPTVAGKYFVYARLKAYGGANSDLLFTSVHIYKNGSDTSKAENNFTSNYPKTISTPVFAVVDLNGTTDYVEFFGHVDGVSAGSEVFQSNGGVPVTIFGAYRIGD